MEKPEKEKTVKQWRNRLLKFASIIVIIALGIAGMKILGSARRHSKKRDVKPIIRKVETEILKPHNLTLKVSGNGLIQSKNVLEIVPAVSGQIVYVRSGLRSGVSVSEDEVVVRLDSRQAENQLHLARADLIKSVVSLLPDVYSTSNTTVYTKWKTYLEKLDLEKSTPKLPSITDAWEKTKVSIHNIFHSYYNVRNAELNLDQYTIRTPFDGSIVESNVSDGAYVRIGQSLLTVMDTRNLEISVPITLEEFDSLQISEHPGVTIYSTENPERTLTGRLERFDKAIKKGTQSIYVHVVFMNPLEYPEFFPGTYVDLSIDGKTLLDVVTVPRHVIKEDRFIYTYENGQLALQPISVMKIEGDNAIIANTLPASTEVVMSVLQKPLIGMKLEKVNGRSKENKSDLDS